MSSNVLKSIQETDDIRTKFDSSPRFLQQMNVRSNIKCSTIAYVNDVPISSDPFATGRSLTALYSIRANLKKGKNEIKIEAWPENYYAEKFKGLEDYECNVQIFSYDIDTSKWSDPDSKVFEINFRFNPELEDIFESTPETTPSGVVDNDKWYLGPMQTKIEKEFHLWTVTRNFELKDFDNPTPKWMESEIIQDSLTNRKSLKNAYNQAWNILKSRNFSQWTNFIAERSNHNYPSRYITQAEVSEVSGIPQKIREEEGWKLMPIRLDNPEFVLHGYGRLATYYPQPLWYKNEETGVAEQFPLMFRKQGDQWIVAD